MTRATTWIAAIAAAAADTALKHHGCPQRLKRPADGALIRRGPVARGRSDLQNLTIGPPPGDRVRSRMRHMRYLTRFGQDASIVRPCR